MSYTPNKYDNVAWEDLPYEEQLRRLQWTKDSCTPVNDGICEICRENKATETKDGISACAQCIEDAEFEDMAWDAYDSAMFDE